MDLGSVISLDYRLPGITCCVCLYSLCAHGRGEEELEVAATRGICRNDRLNVLQIIHFRIGALAGVCLNFPEQRATHDDWPASGLTRIEYGTGFEWFQIVHSCDTY